MLTSRSLTDEMVVISAKGAFSLWGNLNMDSSGTNRIVKNYDLFRNEIMQDQVRAWISR